MKSYQYGSEFSTRERKRINDILYRMKKEGYNITPETRKYITSPKNVREQVAPHVTFQAITKSGYRVGSEYSGAEALKLHKMAVEWNRKIQRASKMKKYKGYDLTPYMANPSLTGIAPSRLHSSQKMSETKEQYKERLAREAEASRRAAEKAWSRDIQEMLDSKREVATENILGILADKYMGSIDVPKELLDEVKKRLDSMSMREFTDFIREMYGSDFDIFEFYKAGYEDAEAGLWSFFKELGFNTSTANPEDGKSYDPNTDTVYIDKLLDGEDDSFPFY